MPDKGTLGTFVPSKLNIHKIPVKILLFISEIFPARFVVPMLKVVTGHG